MKKVLAILAASAGLCMQAQNTLPSTTVNGDFRTTGDVFLNRSLNLSDKFGMKYTERKDGFPAIASFEFFTGASVTETGGKFKQPCNIFYPSSDPNDPYPVMYSYLYANVFSDLLQVNGTTNNTSFLNFGILFDDGVISLEGIPGGNGTMGILRINPACSNDVDICEGGGNVNIFNSANIGGGSYNPQLSALNINLLHSLTQALTITNPALGSVDKSVFKVMAGGQTVIKTSQTDAFIVKDGNDKVNFKVKNTGYVYAREINVMPANIAFPDYVFEKNYKLLPINEMESYIVANKHLPNIPSAKTVEQEGINLGEMQVKQMEKIEEAFLYIIQLKKENEELKNRLAILENNNR
jgi:hypothetical protein